MFLEFYTDNTYSKKFKLPIYAGQVRSNLRYGWSCREGSNDTIDLYEDIDNNYMEELCDVEYQDIPTTNPSRIIKQYPYVKNTSYYLQATYTRLNQDNYVNMDITFIFGNKWVDLGGMGYNLGKVSPYYRDIPFLTGINDSTYGGYTVTLYDTKNKALIYNIHPNSATITNVPINGRNVLVNVLAEQLKKQTLKYEAKLPYVDGKPYADTYFNENSIGKKIYPINLTTLTNVADEGLYEDFFNAIDIKPPEYPNQNPDNDNDPGGTPGSGKPGSQPYPDVPIPGDGDTTSDAIPSLPAKPVFDVTNTGFLVIYNPNALEITQLAHFMWSGDFADLIKKVFREPFQALISLKLLFAPVPSGQSQTVWLGNVETTVSMSKVTSQFIDVDMGSVQVTEFFGSFADYAPFTKIQIFLPFIGYKDLNPDEVMNSTLHLVYRIDVYTGACIAALTVTKTIKSTNLNSILYQFDGNCAMEVPFTSNDNSRYVAAILNTAASSALGVAAQSSFTPPTPAQDFTKAESASLTIGSLAPVANGLLDIMSTKPNVQRAGSLAGATAAMGLKQPYIIIHRPIQHMAADYPHYIGIPLNLTRQLSDVKGYTILSQVFFASSTATEQEITMITELLKSGVIL